MLLVVNFGTATLSEGKGFRCVVSQSVPFAIWTKTNSCTVTLWGNRCSLCAWVYCQTHISQNRLFTAEILWRLPHSHMDIYPSAKMYFSNTFTQRSKQYAKLIIQSQCAADQAAIRTLYLLSDFARATRNHAFILPGAVCKSVIYFSFPCFADLMFPPLFSCLSLLWGHLYLLVFSFQILIAPVASLLLLVAVMIWFSHFPICCNNFILSHSKEAYRQTPVWCVSRKWGEKWSTTATDWFRLCAQASTSAVMGWKWA